LSSTPADDVWPPVEQGRPVGETDLGPRDAALDRPESRARSFALLAITAFLAGDIILVALNIAFGTSAGFPERLNVTRTHGVPEIVLYLQWLLAAAVLWKLRAHAALYAVWSMVFVYRFLDDAFELHRGLERLSNVDSLSLIEPFGPGAGIKEVLGHVVSESVLLILVIGALLAIRRLPTSIDAIRFSKKAIALMVAYVVCLMIGEWLVLFVVSDRRIATILEEGGEMVTGTLLLGLVLLHAAHVLNRPRRPAVIDPLDQP
jgi:hypothetical protein